MPDCEQPTSVSKRNGGKRARTATRSLKSRAVRAARKSLRRGASARKSASQGAPVEAAEAGRARDDDLDLAVAIGAGGTVPKSGVVLGTEGGGTGQGKSEETVRGTDPGGTGRGAGAVTAVTRVVTGAATDGDQDLVTKKTRKNSSQQSAFNILPLRLQQAYHGWCLDHLAFWTAVHQELCLQILVHSVPELKMYKYAICVTNYRAYAIIRKFCYILLHSYHTHTKTCKECKLPTKLWLFFCFKMIFNINKKTSNVLFHTKLFREFKLL